MINSIKLALIHLDIQNSAADDNRQQLVEQIKLAADQGADIVVAPEMTISGYSFKDRAALLPYAETLAGPTVAQLRQLAEQAGVYICVGLALREPVTDSLYNAAVVISPQGELVCEYHKIVAESRWARPGDATQNNTFDTPWGRVGVLICADSYYGLIPRATALRGADLLLIPANWPPTGLEPAELWQARAIENGCYVAACNRTGVDNNFDCRSAHSVVISPGGEQLAKLQSEQTAVCWAEIPLTAEGRIDSQQREQALSGRLPERYHTLYLNKGMASDMSLYYSLPEAGVQDVNCVSATEPEALASLWRESSAVNGLWLLPSAEYSTNLLQQFTELAVQFKQSLLLHQQTGSRYCFISPNGDCKSWMVPEYPHSGDTEFPSLEIGSLFVQLMPYAALFHPEQAVIAAKSGYDLVVCLEPEISAQQQLICGARTIEGLAIAVCAQNGAGIWMRPEGHSRWQEQLCGQGESIGYQLDSRLTRNKRFQDRVDFDLLLGA